MRANDGLVDQPRTTSSNVPAPAAVMLGWLAVALWGAVTIARIPLSPHGMRVRFLHHAVDLGHTLLVALMIAAGAALWTRWGRGGRSASVALVALVSAALAQLLLREDLGGSLERLGGNPESPWALASLSAVVSLAVPVAFAIGRWLARPGLRWLAVAAGVAFIVGNTAILKSGYPGAHALLAACGATSIASALTGARRTRRFVLHDAWIVAGTVLALAGAIASVVIRPSSVLQTELSQRDDTALLVPWLRGLRAPPVVDGIRIPAPLRHWFESRADRPEMPPTRHQLLPKAPIVVVVTIDAFRFDLMEPRHRDFVPNLTRIRQRSVYFSQARSAGAGTRQSLGALFTGRYYSMLPWRRARSTRPTLESDTPVRLPEVLGRKGIPSVQMVSLKGMMLPKHAIARGFDEYIELPDDLPKEVSSSDELVTRAIARLARHGGGPLFLYMHLIEPHVPYDTHGKPSGSPWENYLSEVAFVDAQVGRLRRAIDELGFTRRTAFIVSADHGEAFGEKGVFHHNKTLYEIMVHVPLMIEIPGVPPRQIDQNVSMADIGPTVFDLFRVPTPGFWMAESLIPFLEGGRANPNRLMAMETRSEYAVVFPDRVKAIVNWVNGAEQIYDLTRDPEEKQNLRDTLGAEGDQRIALARAFMNVHARRRLDGKPF